MNSRLNIEDIEKQVKEIIENFIKALEEAGIDETALEEFGTLRSQFMRSIVEPKESDSLFIDLFFKNSPALKGRYLQAEKKKW